MKLTSLSIKNHFTVLVIYILVIVFGWFSYNTMEKAEDPGFTIKTAIITTYWPGATAEQMSLLVSDKIEEVMESMEELKFLQSKNTDGVSTIYVNIGNKYSDVKPIWDRLRNKVATDIMPIMPEGVRGPFVNDEFGDVFGTVISITGEEYNYTELYNYSNFLREKLLNEVPQIGKIDVTGVQKERIYIDYSLSKLAVMGISLRDINNTLKGNNIIISGGTINNNSERISVIPSGNFSSIEDIEKTILIIPNTNETIFLKDVAKITKGYETPLNYKTRYNGKDSITISASLKKGEDNVRLGENVKKIIENLETPDGLDVELQYFQPEKVKKKVLSFMSNLTQAIVIVLLVMFAFLGVRTGLIISSLIPTSIALALIILKSLGYGLDQVSLTGLIIALGMLVDNAIVMAESITVLLEKGKSKFDACIEAADSLKIPLLTSSLTTVAAFVPMYLNEENLGEYIAPLSLIVTLTLLSSWLISMTLVPLLSFLFLKVNQKEEDYKGRWFTFYRKNLIRVLKNRKKNLMLIGIFFIFGVSLFYFIPFKFMPEADAPTMISTIRLPKGSSVEATEEVVKDVEKYIKKNLYVDTKLKKNGFIDLLLTGGTSKNYDKEGVISYGAYIGGGAPRFTLAYTPEVPSTEYAYMIIQVTNYKNMPEYSKLINDYVTRKYPDVDIMTKGLTYGMAVEKEIAYEISSPNLFLLREVVEEVKDKFETMPELRVVNDQWGKESRKLTIDIDRENLKQAGLSNQEMAMTLQSVITGVPITTFKNSEGGPKNRDVPIYLRSDKNIKNSISDLESIEIFSSRVNRKVSLKEVADLNLKREPSYIYKRDRVYTIKVGAGLKSENLNDAMKLDVGLHKWFKEKNKEWGDSVKIKLVGESEESFDNMKGIIVKLPYAGAIIVLLLISQFNGLKKPLIILGTIPLGIIGVSIGLLLGRQPFGFMGFIGLVSLSGIVINNAIVLIDRIEVEIDEFGREPKDAVIEATQGRLRPILLTTITTLCGLAPLWFFGGPLFKPLAISLMFGLIFGTILTLGVVPLLYSIFYKVNFKDYEVK